jgi:WD40 repeat protein/serine/threonine protein kinase
MSDSGIFKAAVKLPANQRAEYLDQACGDNQALRQEVESLLQAHDTAGSFLGHLSNTREETEDNQFLPERPGTVIGSYKLLEQIGEGGFGIVFMAEQQQPIRRKVALKVIKPGMDTRQVIARFEAERQALALMDHPNIAKVLDAGAVGGARDEGGGARETESESISPYSLSPTHRPAAVIPRPSSLAPPSGRPYFVMELVRGQPITDYCDQNSLPIRDRLDLFLHVCQAVQHAHQKGIIHRDLKPSNVLVTHQDGIAVPKIIDFGIAKALCQQLTDKTLYTGFAQLIGTPMYMSPEQAELCGMDVDTRSDIYSLGVLLYELLTSTTPFEQHRLKAVAYDEMRRIIREEEPPKPSTRVSTLGQAARTISIQRQSDPKRLSHLFRGELDWIVMKCLEKDRNRRYDTAGGVARDIERYLHDEPLQACPPSAGYRLRKFLRRNKGPAMAACLVLVVLIGGMIGTIWQAMEATQQRNAKQSALEQSQLLSAELAFDKGQLLGESGDPSLALLWLARSLQLLPPDAGKLQVAIRTNLDAWQRQVNTVRMTLPEEGPFGVAFAPDGKIVTVSVTPGTDTVSVRRRDPITGQSDQPLTFSGESLLNVGLTFSRRVDCMLIASPDGTFRLRDLVTGKLVWEKGGQDISDTFGLDFSPDGQKVLIGYGVGPPQAVQRTGKAELIEVATGRRVGPALVHPRPVIAGAFHPDGQSFVTECGNWGNSTEKVEAHFWDLDGREIRKPLEHPCMTPAVAFSPDKTKLLTGHWDYKARLWNLAAPQEPIVMQLQGPILCVAFSPDGQTLATGSANCSVQLWDLKGRPLGPALRQGQQVRAVEFSADGKSLLVIVRGNTARLWDLAASARLKQVEILPKALFPLAISPDRQTILTRDADHTVQLRDVATNQPVGKPLPHQRPVLIGGTVVPEGQRQACSSDRQRVLTVDADNEARLWDAQTGQLITPLKPEPESAFFAAAFSPDSKYIVTGNAEAAYLWEASTGKRIWKLEHGSGVWVFSVAFHPEGRMMLLGDSDGFARFRNPNTRETIGPPLSHDSAVFTLAFSPDGRTVLTGDVDQNAQLWDVGTRRRLLNLVGHHGCINDAAFSPDGRFILTGSQDKTARLWDVATGKPIGPPVSHPGEVIRVAFGHDGSTILTATDDQMTRSWPVPIMLGGSAEEIELWAELATGIELEAEGSARVLDAAAWHQRRQKLEGSRLLVP